MITRRKFITSAGAVAGSTALLQKLASAQEVKTREPNKPRETTAAANKNKPLIERVDPKPTLPPGEPGKDYTPVITPNNISLPWKMVDGVKVFHLIAEPVEHEFAPNLKAHCLLAPASTGMAYFCQTAWMASQA
jgi:manganese oxidase